MSLLNINDKAPDFTLPSKANEIITLSNYQGKKNVVLYFYPKDDTPGCTAEACDFRDNMAKLKSHDTIVLGISQDDLKSHDRFKEKFRLPFPLLSDETAEIIHQYNSWGEKSMFGKKFEGIIRNTFLIDKKGVIRHIWKNVKVKGHVETVLKRIESLQK